MRLYVGRFATQGKLGESNDSSRAPIMVLPPSADLGSKLHVKMHLLDIQSISFLISSLSLEAPQSLGASHHS